MEPIRNERMEIVGYRQELPDGRVTIRDKHRELVGWTQFSNRLSVYLLVDHDDVAVVRGVTPDDRQSG